MWRKGKHSTRLVRMQTRAAMENSTEIHPNTKENYHMTQQVQVFAPTSNAEEAKFERFYEDLQDLLELTPQKDVLFIIGDWNAKVGSQEIPAVTGKFGLGVQNEAGQRLKEFCQGECTGHSKHLLPTTQEKTLHMNITR